MLRRTFIFGGAGALAIASNAGAAATTTAHDFAFTSIDGGVLRLKDFAGKPVLVVNTASRCGFTHQYEALQDLYETYRNDGLVVLGVPSDDFGGQELATESEVKEFCEVNFAIDFPMTGITRVRGSGQHPFYAWARNELGRSNAPRWNFHKYLVDGDGELIAAFGTGVEPDSAEIKNGVEEILATR